MNIQEMKVFKKDFNGSMSRLLDEVEELLSADSLAEKLDEAADVLHFLGAAVVSCGLNMDAVFTHLHWKREQRETVGKDKAAELLHAASIFNVKEVKVA